MGSSYADPSMQKAIREFLSEKVDLLAGLTVDEYETLASVAELKRYSPGDLLAEQGKEGGFAFILKSGAVDTYMVTPKGTTIQLPKIHIGELFGEMSLFDDREIRTASVIAKNMTEVIVIDRNNFERQIAKKPEVAMRLMAVIAKRLRHSDAIVSDFSDRVYGDVLPRIEQAVSAQLESTSKQAGEALKSAHFLRTFLTWLVSIGSVTVTAVAIGMGFFGLTKFSDWENQANNVKNDIEDRHNQAIKLVDDLETKAKSLNVIVQSKQAFEALVIMNLKQDLQLVKTGSTAASMDNYGDQSKDFTSAASMDTYSEQAKDFTSAYIRLKSELLENPRNWNSETLVEGLNILIRLVRRSYIPSLDENYSSQILTVIEEVLKYPPSDWRDRQRMMSVIEDMLNDKLYKKGVSSIKVKLANNLEILLNKAVIEDDDVEQAYTIPSKDASMQMALLLLKIGKNKDIARRTLDKLQKNSKNPWQKSQATVALSMLGEESGWNTLRSDLAKGWSELSDIAVNNTYDEPNNAKVAAFASAFQLAEIATSDTKDDSAKKIIVMKLQDELDPTKFQNIAEEKYMQSWGVDLIAATIYEFTNQKSMPALDNKLFWQYSCEMICKLSCDLEDPTKHRKWCDNCVKEIEDDYHSLKLRVNPPFSSCDKNSVADN